VPEELISRDTLVKIFAELHLMEGLYIHGTINETDSVYNLEAYRQGIYSKFNIEQERFEETYNFYVQYPQLLYTLYDEVIIELERYREESQNLSSESEGSTSSPE
jgi:hypothetical protein